MMFKKKRWASFIWLVLLSWLVYTVGQHFRQIAASVDAVDEEAAMIQQAKKLVPPGTRVSFATNLNGDEASQGAYYRTQFCWCPVVLPDKVMPGDDILYYYSPAAADSGQFFFYHSDTIWQHSTDQYTLMLLKPKSN